MTGERVAQLLYVRHARRLLARHEGERSGPLVVENGRPVPPGTMATGDEQRLRNAVDALAATLVSPADARLRAEAEVRRAAADDLAGRVVLAQHDFERYIPRPAPATRTS